MEQGRRGVTVAHGELQLPDDTLNPHTASFKARFNVTIYKSVFALQNVMGNANGIYLGNEIGLRPICFNLIWWSFPSAPSHSFSGSSPFLHPHVPLEFRQILRPPFSKGELGRTDKN